MFFRTEIKGADAVAGKVHLQWLNNEGQWVPLETTSITGGIQFYLGDVLATDTIMGFDVLPGHTEENHFRIAVDADATGGALTWTSKILKGIDGTLNGTEVFSQNGTVNVTAVVKKPVDTVTTPVTPTTPAVPLTPAEQKVAKAADKVTHTAGQIAEAKAALKAAKASHNKAAAKKASAKLKKLAKGLKAQKKALTKAKAAAKKAAKKH